MNRRSFLALLATFPIIGNLVPKRPSSVYIRWVTTTGTIRWIGFRVNTVTSIGDVDVRLESVG